METAPWDKPLTPRRPQCRMSGNADCNNDAGRSGGGGYISEAGQPGILNGRKRGVIRLSTASGADFFAASFSNL